MAPVMSAQDAALAGHDLQTLLPGLNCFAGQTVIATQAEPVYTGVVPLHPHFPVDGVFKLKIDAQPVQTPVGPEQVVQF